MSHIHISSHGHDAPESLPGIAEDIAARLGLVYVTNDPPGTVHYDQCQEHKEFWSYTLTGRDSHGRHVDITTFTDRESETS